MLFRTACHSTPALAARCGAQVSAKRPASARRSRRTVRPCIAPREARRCGVAGGAPHPREAPAVGLRVAREAQLAARARADDHLLHQPAQLGLERVAERAHEVAIALQRRAAGERTRRLVREERDVLAVALPARARARPVREEQVRVRLAGLRARAGPGLGSCKALRGPQVPGPPCRPVCEEQVGVRLAGLRARGQG